MPWISTTISPLFAVCVIELVTGLVLHEENAQIMNKIAKISRIFLYVFFLKISKKSFYGLIFASLKFAPLKNVPDILACLSDILATKQKIIILLSGNLPAILK